jgi:hypothetical protein
MNGVIESLPFPKRSFTWFAVIILLVLSYLFYYEYGYGFLKQEYNNKLEIYEYDYEVEILNEKTNVIEIAHYDIVVKAPDVVTDFETQWAYLEIENNSTVYSSEPIEIYFNFVPNPYLYPEQFLHQSYSEDTYLYSTVKFENILPSMKAYARLPFITEKSVSEGIMKVFINGEDQNKPIKLKYDDTGNILSLFYSFINQLMLPPWSNGIILLTVIFICYFIEESKIWNERINFPFYKHFCSWFNIFTEPLKNGINQRVNMIRKIQFVAIAFFILIVLFTQNKIIIWSLLLIMLIYITFPLKKNLREYIKNVLVISIVGMLIFLLLTGLLVKLIISPPTLDDGYLLLLKCSLGGLLIVFANLFYGETVPIESKQKIIEIKRGDWKFSANEEDFYLAYETKGKVQDPKEQVKDSLAESKISHKPSGEIDHET